MSNTLVCLSEAVPFYAQDISENNFRYDNSKNCLKSEMENVNLVALPQDENSYIKKNSVMRRQNFSRKREASNVLVECVKRRDNLRNIEFITNVPSINDFNHDDNLNISTELSATAAPEIANIQNNKLQNDYIYSDSSVTMDLSDSSSVTDSGVDCLSKSSSPSHSIDNISSKSYVQEEVCKQFMEIAGDKSVLLSSPSEDNKDSNHCRQSGRSTVAIYEDLNCLHLTDETVPHPKESPQSDITSVKSPITKSLFKNFSSTIYFPLKNETLGAFPDHVLPLLKWKLSTITPVLIREMVLKCGFRLLDIDTTEDWLGTWGKHLKCASFKRVKTYQKVNHYPGSFHLGRKDKLWDNYRRMQTKHGTAAYNFFPETFLLPTDLKSLRKAWEKETDKCWILKPPASARGTGVKVIYKWSQVPKNRPVVVQRYVSDPYLINGTKFDLRVYVLVPSFEPLRIYVFEDGLVRFASEKYSLSNKSFGNRFVHLTNYSINRKSSSYTANEDENTCQGHKWSLKSFWSYMSNSGIDISKIKEAIIDMIIKTIICTEGPICRLMKTYAKSTYNCFELFGFDIMLDKDLRPWLLEVNISPSLHTRSMLDSHVKGQLVKDMFNIAGFQVPEENFFSAPDNSDPNFNFPSFMANRHKSLRNKYLSAEEKKKHSLYTFQHSNENFNILQDLTPDDLHCLVESEDEFNRRGFFTRVFPTETSSKYFAYFEHMRYYNILLDAWEKCFHSNRSTGICRLQDLCNEGHHLCSGLKEPAQSQTVEPALSIIAH